MSHRVLREEGQFQLVEDNSAGYPTWFFRNTILVEHTKGKGVSYNIDDEEKILMLRTTSQSDFVRSAKQRAGNDINSLEVAESLWEKLGDIPVNDDEELDEDYITPWLTFFKGSDKFEVWHWFESHFDISVAKDLMGLE